MRLLLVAALALAGLAIGPVQRAVIVRRAVTAGEPPRRCCPQCGEQALAAGWQLLSVSAVAGRCDGCRARVGPPPLVIEFATAVLLAALASRVHPGLVLVAACWLAVCCVPLGWIDAAVRRLPDVLTTPAYLGTMAALLAAAGLSGHWHDLVRSLLGGIAMAGFYLVLTLISPAGMGLGDVKLAASLGSLLAWFGWNVLLAGAFAGFLLASVYGITLLALRRATRKQQIAFGPFMIAGTFAVILIGAAVGSH